MAAWATMDAGPHVKVLTTTDDASTIAMQLRDLDGVDRRDDQRAGGDVAVGGPSPGARRAMTGSIGALRSRRSARSARAFAQGSHQRSTDPPHSERTLSGIPSMPRAFARSSIDASRTSPRPRRMLIARHPRTCMSHA